MQYLLSVFIDESADVDMSEMEEAYKNVDAFNRELMESGAWVLAGGLTPTSSATTVSIKNDDVITTDGPYIETKEVLGGFWIIKASDLDEALVWAEKGSRACAGPVEVRPFADEGEVTEV